MREGCDRAFVEMQIAALEHLGQSRVAGGIREYHGRIVWMLHWLPGKLLADTKYHRKRLLRNYGSLLSSIDRKLANFDHPSAHRKLKWDLKRASWIREHIHLTPDPALIERILAMAPDLSKFRHGVIPATTMTTTFWSTERRCDHHDFGDLRPHGNRLQTRPSPAQI